MDNNLLYLYTYYLITSASLVIARGISKILNNQKSHDKITRFLSSRDFTSKDLKSKIYLNDMKVAIQQLQLFKILDNFEYA